MRFRTAVLTGVLVLVCGTGWAQTKNLGDVAGSIKLNPSAIVEKKGVVEDPRVAKKADGELLGDLLADCSAEAEQLAGLVEQARATTVYRGDPLLNRIDELARELERQLQEFSTLRLGDEFAEPSRLVELAVDFCDTAAARVQEELRTGGATFSQAKGAIAGCRQVLDTAIDELAATMTSSDATREIAAASSPQPNEEDASSSDDEIIDRACKPAQVRGQELYEACRREQYLNQAELATRSAENEMLDEGVFGDIRDLCFRLHPRDFVGRNICEQDRMTAVRFETE